MLKERRLAANKIAEQLFAAEAAIDAAVAAVAQLAAVMPMARQEANIAACIGQDALISTMQTCQQLIEARGSIIATHAALRQAQTKVGLDAVNFLGPCPDHAYHTDAAPAPRFTIAA